MTPTRPPRQPKSKWRSSPLSPNHGDLKQPWHRKYGRLGRRYDTIIRERPSSIEDDQPWEVGYRENLYMRTALQRRCGLADRTVPVLDLSQSSSQRLRSDGKATDVEERLSRPSMHEAAGGSGSVKASEDESEDDHPRYTAAEKGKQREGEDPVPTVAKGPSALKPAVRDNLQSSDPRTPAQSLRLPPRHSSVGDDWDEDRPSSEQIEYADLESTAEARPWPARKASAEFLKAARRGLGFAPELPPDGLGVVRDKSSVQSVPWMGRTGNPSSVSMTRARSQIGGPDSRSQAVSVMMQRTSRRVGTSASGSQEQVDAVAKSNRRLEELSPHSAEAEFPDTPMPYLKIGMDNDEPFPLSLLPASEAEDDSGGGGPRPEAPEPYHAPTSPRKRDSSEISGGCVPGPSKHHQPPRPAGPSANVAIMSVNGRERPISSSELRARVLQPPPPIQKELCKLYSVLVQVVQVASDAFVVVESHSFIEALSGGAEVARRICEEATTPDQQYRKLLVPLSYNEYILLAVIDLSVTAFQIFSPTTEQDTNSSESIDRLEIQEAVYGFICTVFPNQCRNFQAWKISFERTVQGPVAINTPAIVSGRYTNESGGSIQLQSILPIFFEVLRVVCGLETRKTVDDEALLTRLFAIFEQPLRPDTLSDIKSHRTLSQAGFDSLLKGRIKKALKRHDQNFRTMITTMGSEYSPPDLIKLRLEAMTDVSRAVMQSQVAAGDLMVQHSQIRAMLDGMAHRCTIARSWLYHELALHMIEKWFYTVDAAKTVLKPEAALNKFKIQKLNNFARKIHRMKAELDHWLGMLNEHLNTA